MTQAETQSFDETVKRHRLVKIISQMWGKAETLCEAPVLDKLLISPFFRIDAD